MYIFNASLEKLWPHYMASLGWDARTVLQKMQFYVWSVKDTRVRMYLGGRLDKTVQTLKLKSWGSLRECIRGKPGE